MVAGRIKKSERRAEAAIRFIESYLFIPEGKHVGKPMKLRPFQKKWIRAIYSGNPSLVRMAILSIARKNGKTALIAALVLVHLVGPEAIKNTQIVSGAQSQDQAGLVFELAKKMVLMSPVLSQLVRIVPSRKRLYGLPMNVEYRALSAEGKTAHGLSPVLAILDEVGQVRGQKDKFIEAIETSQGAHENPLLLVISTQAETDNDLLSIWIDDALKNEDPSIVCHLYTSNPKCGVMDKKAWRESNPALGDFRSEKDMQNLATKAARLPSFSNTFRNLNLNQRISTTSPLISRESWRACEAPPRPLAECDSVYGGIDLSGKTDLTALILLGIFGKEVNVHCYFWTPEDGLLERSKRDRAPYDVWVDSGHLLTTPGATIDYEYTAKQMKEICAALKIEGIHFDRWRIDLLKKELEDIGCDLPLEECGQGYKDMSPAVEAMEEFILKRQLRHGNHPVLNMCAANCVTLRDPAGNRKPDKERSNGRIDGVVALAMASKLAQENIKQGDINDFLNNPIRT
jgi:phage terminase large subunit-like protein